MASAATAGHVEMTNLVGGHCERVNIGRFHGVAVFLPGNRGGHLFRCHVTNNAPPTGCCATLFRDEGISDDLRDPKVPDTCRTFRSD